MQGGYPRIGQCLIWTSHILKLAFVILLIKMLSRGFSTTKPILKLLLAIVLPPFIMISCTMTMLSGRFILNASRPINPNKFIKNVSMVNELNKLADEMITQPRVFWIGNGTDHFIFSLKYNDGNFSFDSKSISDAHDFTQPVWAEDMSTAVHFDSPFIDNSLKPTNQKLVDHNEYTFCKRASSVIRKYGFSNIKLYPESNVVQYQIYDFIGWDNGSYYVYYYCPDTHLPNDFKYKKKLNSNWYYIRKPRFQK